MISDPEIEKKLGNKLVFEYNEWQGPGWHVSGDKLQYRTAILQTPWNCGQLIVGGFRLANDNTDNAEVQTFIAKNVGSACGYGTLTTSVFKQSVASMEKAGWKLCYEADSSRGSPRLYYMILNIPKSQMKVWGYCMAEDTFIPAQHKSEINHPVWSREQFYRAKTEKEALDKKLAENKAKLTAVKKTTKKVTEPV